MALRLRLTRSLSSQRRLQACGDRQMQFRLRRWGSIFKAIAKQRQWINLAANFAAWIGRCVDVEIRPTRSNKCCLRRGKITRRIVNGTGNQSCGRKITNHRAICTQRTGVNMAEGGGAGSMPLT